MAEFVTVAKASDLGPGRGKVVSAGGREVALFNVGGRFHAIENTCPHRGGPLGEGDLEGAVVTCPWHGWQFDVATGASPVNPAAKVRTFPVEVVGDEVRVEIG